MSFTSSPLLLFDSSHWGRLEISGADRLRFLHNQTTNTFQLRQPGEGCETLFVTSTARTLDLATAYIQDDRVSLLLSPQRYQYLLNWLDRYIFPADHVVLMDKTPDTCCFRVMGTQAAETLLSLRLEALPKGQHSHCLGTIATVPVLVAQGSGLSQPGFTLIAAQEYHDTLQNVLLSLPDAQQLLPEDWEKLRILDGRPAADAELTEDYNPLEAGLWQTLSFDKGCYIGQETIARLNTYKGVKQRLWGIDFGDPSEIPPLGPLWNPEGEKVGQLTSIARTDNGVFGLGYLRTKAGGEGTLVQVETPSETHSETYTGTIVAVPFIRHEV